MGLWVTTSDSTSLWSPSVPSPVLLQMKDREQNQLGEHLLLRAHGQLEVRITGATYTDVRCTRSGGLRLAKRQCCRLTCGSREEASGDLSWENHRPTASVKGGQYNSPRLYDCKDGIIHRLAPCHLTLAV
ncbi:hypothetical protein NDU88_003332 [Pleurodeles waltl]|uniref:Uncharacterized protein n=1 Tax=Pleurodeles waltl TaxID=8319 RepID=A0AAV7UZR1_PLEWA|nr:hypothetical protein NDU88_003332 [Pleurodeles waltl]